MTIPSATITPKYRAARRRLWMLVLAIALLATLAAYMSYQDFVQAQSRLAAQAVTVAEYRIQNYVREMREKVRLLVYSHKADVQRLIRHPSDESAYEILKTHVSRYFPNYFAFTISDPAGDQLYFDDFGERIGDFCRNDIREFVSHNFKQGIYIHPGPDVFHFDIMEVLNDEAGNVAGVFYVSLTPDILQKILFMDEPENQHLYLVRSDAKGLIEVGAEGTRDVLLRETHLNEQESASVLRSVLIPGTRWNLLSVPDGALFSSKLHHIGLLLALFLAALVSVAGVAMLLLRRADHALQVSQNIYRSLVTSIEGVVWRAQSRPFRFTFISPQIDGLFRISADAWTNDIEQWYSSMHPEDRDRIRTIIEQGVEGDAIDLEYRLKTGNGNYVWIRDLIHQVPSDDGDGPLLIGIMINVTRHHQVEERLREQTRQLRVSNQELESFSYSVSHDLRSPLRAINGYSLILAEDYADRLDNEAQHVLSRIRAASDRMGALIDAMLQLSRVTQAKLKPERVDLSAIADAMHDEIVRGDPQRSVAWHIQEGIVAFADPVLLRVVLQNLLENAWKFTRTTAAACISVGAEVVDGAVEVSVRDNGVGFDMQHAANLFSPFHRLHGDEEYEGTGIGLATVKRIIERHGGKIWAKSEVGGGADIRFTLRECDDIRPRFLS